MVGGMLCLAAILCAAELSLSDYSAAVKTDVETQIRKALNDRGAEDTLAGTVSLAAEDCFFLQGERDAMKVVWDDAAPRPGSKVLVRGRPSLEGGRVVFLAAEVEKTGEAPLPSPVEADGRDLVFVTMDGKDSPLDVNWKRVKICGRAINLTDAGFAMEVDDIPVTVFVTRLPPFLGDCGATRPKLDVVGVPELVLDQSSLFGRPRRVMGVKFHVSEPGDITLLPDLRYRLNRREAKVQIAIFSTIVALGAMLVVLLAFIVRQARRQLRTRTLMHERKRMADDLHDTIEQHLVGAGMLLQLGKTREARDILVRAKREMRDIVWGLKNDDMMRLTPAEMIREYARAENRKGVYRIDTRLSGLPERMDASQMRDLSLIVREAVGNAVKHGGAKKIAITCDSAENGGWLLRIANDGTPFDSAKAPGPAEGHFGLEGMKARARRLGAELDISLRDSWTVVSLRG